MNDIDLLIERIKVSVPSVGVHTANSYTIVYKKSGAKIAKKNPRFEQLERLGGKVIAKWNKKVNKVVK